MTRLPTPIDPAGSALEQFAWMLRSLRDQMGSSAPSVDDISEREGIPRSTLYAALRGDRLPRREVVAALVRSWGGDEVTWLAKRSEVESQLASRGDFSYAPLGSSQNLRGSGARFSSKTMDLLRTKGVLQRYDNRERILREGELAEAVLVIEKGIVKELAETSLGEALLGILVDGDMLNFSVLDGQPLAASSVAVGSVVVIAVSNEDFRAILTENIDASLEMARQIAARLRGATRRRVDIVSVSPVERLRRVLVELSNDYGKKRPDGSIEISIGLNAVELGKLIGVSTATAHRAFRELRSSGMLAIGRNTILFYPSRSDGG